MQKILQLLSQRGIALALTVLVSATIYNSWHLTKTNDELVSDQRLERVQNSEERRELLEHIEQLQTAYDALVKTDQQHLNEQKALLDWLATQGIEIPSRFVAAANANPKYIHPNREKHSSGGSGKAHSRTNGSGGQNENSGNGSNGGSKNNHEHGSKDKDHGESGDKSHGKNKSEKHKTKKHHKK